MLSEALQRNAKHEARLSNISDLFPFGSGQRTKLIRDSSLRSEWTAWVAVYFFAAPLPPAATRCSLWRRAMTK
jgi:hypothetical protein